jgi:hypothetical protein
MTENTTTALPGLLGTLTVSNAQASESLQVFGLNWVVPTGPEYLTLEQALEAGTLVVTETSEGGSVPELRVINRGDIHVLLVQGDILVGAKQNRTLNTTILVRPHSGMPIPVSCVEQGRWSYASRTFGSRGTSSHNRLRREVTRDVHCFYLSGAGPRSDQGKVWGEVDRKLRAMESPSASRALDASYERHATRIEKSRADVPCPKDAQGALFAYGGKVVGMEIFDRPETLAAHWHKLVGSHLLDVLELKAGNAVPVSGEAANEWLRGLPAVAVHAHPSPGEGKDLRLQGQSVIGSALEVEGSVLHLAAFAEDTPES